jgi:hypothetical protein
MDDPVKDDFEHAGAFFPPSQCCHFYIPSVSVVAAGAGGGREENKGSNLMGNKYNICIVSLRTMPEIPPASRPVTFYVQHCTMREIFFVFQSSR